MATYNTKQFYINGSWVDPIGNTTIPLINPDTEEVTAELAAGTSEDLDKAVQAAAETFEAFSMMPLKERVLLLERLKEVYVRRMDEMAEAISLEMGAPIDMAKKQQAPAGLEHIDAILDAVAVMQFEEKLPSGSMILREPIGVCGLITPWNWPMNQVLAKVAPALVTGCTCILKPSEVAPLSSILFSEMVHEAGYPAGVYNMVHGAGEAVGQAMSSHPNIDMISFTGSTRAGISVAKNAADSVKRVTQELGGKSPNIIFESADPEFAVKSGILHCFNNSGQSCNAPTRMLIHESIYDRCIELAGEIAGKIQCGHPGDSGRHIGPVVNRVQFEKIQGLIQAGIDEGAKLLVGGPGRPEGMSRGFYVRPTVFYDVNNDMRIAREEIFGPVLSIIPFKDLDEAVEIANDTPYGLQAYFHTRDAAQARMVLGRLRAGTVNINGTSGGGEMPFGGYKQSGNGRESGLYGLHDYLELKSVNGFNSI